MYVFKRNLRRTLSGLLLIAACFAAVEVKAVDSCEEEGRIPQVCYRMKHIRALINMLDGQRDLVQVNYPFVSAIGSSLEDTVSQLLAGRFPDNHLKSLSDLRNFAAYIYKKAEERNPHVFITANEVGVTCKACHNNANLPDGIPTFEQVFASNWDKIIDHCNGAGRHPFVCKNMNAMVKAFGFYHSALQIGEFDYKLAKLNALELQRIVKNLLSLEKPFHKGGFEPLKEIERRAQELVVLADANDPEIFTKSRHIMAACQGCHALK